MIRLSPIDHVFTGVGAYPLEFVFAYGGRMDADRLAESLRRALALFPAAGSRLAPSGVPLATAHGAFLRGMGVLAEHPCLTTIPPAQLLPTPSFAATSAHPPRRSRTCSAASASRRSTS